MSKKLRALRPGGLANRFTSDQKKEEQSDIYVVHRREDHSIPVIEKSNRLQSDVAVPADWVGVPTQEEVFKVLLSGDNVMIRNT